MVDRALLKYELGNLERIEKEYESLGLPVEYKQKFLEFMIHSIHDVFDLRTEPWTQSNREAWDEILEIYQRCETFGEVKRSIEDLIEGVKRDEELAERLAREERWNYENR